MFSREKNQNSTTIKKFLAIFYPFFS